MIGSTGTSGLISNIYIQHFPGGTLDENPLASKESGFDSWSGKIPHAEGATKPESHDY